MATRERFTSDNIAADIVLVSPSDTVDLEKVAGGFLIGATAGNIVIRTGLGGTSLRTIAVAANQTIFVEITRIESTNTTATPIYALYFRS